MARRGGKAASRRSRQRRAQRAAQAPAAPSPAAPSPAAAPPTDAFEAADAALRASTPPPGSRSQEPGQRRSVRARTSDFLMSAGPSRLSERAAAEYHYVARDLRNIGILLAVIIVLLIASALVVNLLDIGQA